MAPFRKVPRDGTAPYSSEQGSVCMTTVMNPVSVAVSVREDALDELTRQAQDMGLGH